MATQERGSTSGIDFSQEILEGKELGEEALRDVLSNNIRQIMNSTGAAMRILDTNFNVVFENDQMVEMGGVEAESSELVNCYDQFCHPEVCGTDNCTLKQVVDEGKDEIRVEVEKESYDGRVIPTELVVKPIRDEDGDVVAISETFRDISDRKDATERIKQAVDELKATSHDVADNSKDISTRAADQLDAISEIASEVSGLSATVEEVAATADEVSSVSERARQRAETGQAEATDTI
jgi:methyl-accepting chemotaxis protein